MAGWREELGRGLRAPLRIYERASAKAGPTGYGRVVRWQLLVVVLVLGLFSPLILDGVRLAETRRDHKVHYDGHALHISSSLRDDDEPEEPPAKDEKDADDQGSSAQQEAPAKPKRRKGVHVVGEAFIQRHVPWLLPSWLAIVSFYGAWILTELLAYALFRDHIDQLTDELARRCGLPVRVREGPPKRPRVRLDFGWMWRRTVRQVLAAVVFASGLPFFLVAQALPFRLAHVFYPLVLGLWGSYWIVVTTAAKSDAAWTTPPTRAPFFRRWLHHANTNIRGFRWWLPRWYERVWTRLTDKLDRAAELAEARPVAFAGLGVIRILATLPVLSILLRPLVSVAASAVALSREEEIVGGGETP